MTPTTTPAPPHAALASFRSVRLRTEFLCQPLEIEDYGLQSMPDASPPKWHLAHTTWFFETFLLTPLADNYVPFHPYFTYLFNSYYNAVGERWPRPQRGLLSRPTVAQVYEYREHVDERIAALLSTCSPERWESLEPILTLGLHHEQQHQELLLTDLKHAFALNPLQPIYGNGASAAAETRPLEWVEYAAGVRWIGADGAGFAFDNETPRHRVFVEAFQLASRPATCGEYLAFIADGGYQRTEWWLSDGWDACRRGGWQAPLYWEKVDGEWSIFTLHGRRPLCDAEPVCCLSYYEADAFARWSGARLPTEAEWETAAEGLPLAGNFLEDQRWHPAPASGARSPAQLFGDVWEWTASPYIAYPGYRPSPGALGEYNGKFMCNQLVLRGGSCATPRTHLRRSYRNFFPPEARWQFSGVRLARDP